MKRIYKLTVIEEREEVPSRSAGIKGNWGLLVRVALSVAAYFHWGH
jgi:hypothetical protein